jgi:hypothetical protein
VQAKLNNSNAQKICQNRPDVKEKNIIARKEYSNRPDVKERFAQWSKEYHNREDVKQRTSEWTKKYFESDEDARFRLSNHIKEYYATEYKEDIDAQRKRSEIAKEINSRDNIKECKSSKSKEMWENKDFKKRMCEKQKEVQNRPERKMLNSVHGLSLWQNPEYADKVMKSSFKYKDFTLPSGKIIKIQGYEPQVLTELLKTYAEEDIVIGVKEMNLTIGRISYVFENKASTYFPDFYIKSTNTIIEVKSKYMFELHKERNLAKEQACLQQGFKFEFIIF